MDKPLTRSQKKAKAAERAREYRQRCIDAGRPATRIVDQALAEALSFEIARVGALGRKPGEAGVDVFSILKTATTILKREGYDKALSAAAVIARVRARPEHKAADYVPALIPHRDPTARIPDRIAPRGPRPDCRPPVPVVELLDLDAQRSADIDWFFEGISERAE